MRIRDWGWVVGLFVLVSRLQAQTPAPQLPLPTVAPPHITFPDWREVERDDDSVEYSVQFPSAVTSSYPSNDFVPLRILMPLPHSGPVPVVLVTHYWGATDLRAERSLAQDLNRTGIAVAIMTLPYHLSRAPLGTRSGELAIQPDVDRLKSTMTQAVSDIRRSIDFLNSRSEFAKRPLGLAGTSLGAVVASLAYAVEPRVTHATFLLGGVDLAHILWTSSRVVPQRDALRRRGFNEEKLRSALTDVEPLTYLPRTVHGDTLVINARYDTVMPELSSTELFESLDHPHILTIDTGHYGGIFVQRRLLREISKFFSDEFSGHTYVAPQKLVAPTLRLGIRAATPNRFDVGAGIDLFHLDAKGDRFGTLFITPRGIEVFVGQKIAQELAVGIVGSTRQLGVGLFWSAVL